MLTHSPVFARIAVRICIAACVFTATCTCAAEVVAELRPIGAFKTVRLIGSADLLITQADTPSLWVEGEPDVLKYLHAEVQGDELVLKYERSGFFWHFPSYQVGPRFVLTAKALDAISASGSGNVQANDLVASSDFSIAVSGSSDVVVKALMARKLTVHIDGSGDVSLSGAALEQHVQIIGSGDYSSRHLQSLKATVSIKGSGDASVWARDELSVTISGSGDVKYFGRPQLSKTVAGSGSVSSAGEGS